MLLRTFAFSTLLALSPLAALSQGASVNFGDEAHDNSQPVEIAADSFEIDDNTGSAVLKGNVRVKQDNMRLSAARVDVDYGSDGGDIERLHARGDVILVSGEDVAEGNEAVYTLSSGNVVLTGEVIVTQGRNVISGDKLDINLDGNTGVMTGRVRAVLQSGQGN